MYFFSLICRIDNDNSVPTFWQFSLAVFAASYALNCLKTKIKMAERLPNPFCYSPAVMLEELLPLFND